MNDKYALICVAWLFALSIAFLVKERTLVQCYNTTVDKIVAINSYQKLRLVKKKIVNGKLKIVDEKFKFSITGGCSAVLVRKDGVILTAAHCTLGTSLMRIETAKGHVYRATVITRDRESDLALLKIVPTPQERFSVAKTGTLRPVGWPVYILANPNNWRFKITQGIISGYDGSLLVSDATVQHGSSGGGLFDVETDKLLGIVHGMVLDSMFGGFAGISLAVPTDKIESFLDRNLPLCG